MKKLFALVAVIVMISFFGWTVPLVQYLFPLTDVGKFAAFINYVYTSITLLTLVAVFGAALAAYDQLAHLHKQTQLLSEQAGAVGAAIKTNTVQVMVNSHRDLLGKILDHEDLYQVFSADSMTITPSSRIYLSMFLNHGLQAFTLKQHHYIDEEWWAAIKMDMRNVFGKETVKRWWNEVKQYYPARYQRFIDTEVIHV